MTPLQVKVSKVKVFIVEAKRLLSISFYFYILLDYY